MDDPAAPSDPLTLFRLPGEPGEDRTPLRTFQRRMPPHRRRGPLKPDDLADWTARHADGFRGQAPSGTVHRMVPEQWLPACGAGQNGWNPQQLTPTDEPVTCGRCDTPAERVRRDEHQLNLF